MACEFFDEGKLARCAAVTGLLIPSHHEREKYCRTDGCAACPTYRLYQLRGGPVSQEAYYGLWAAPPPAPVVPAPPPAPADEPRIAVV